MKLLLVSLLFLALVVNSWALKDAACGEEFGLIGRGRAFFMRWSYDKNTNKCNLFGYGGIDGNNNSFDSEQECIDKCVETD